MSTRDDQRRLALLRRQARRLLQQLRSSAAAESRRAAERFRRLRSLSLHSVEDLVSDHDTVRLKHALAVIAEEHGYASWTALKTALVEDDAWYARGMDAFLNHWFSNYETARTARQMHGGYLLPYRRQYLVCSAEAVELLGLEPGDPDWAAIGWDCAHPADFAAFRRLLARRRSAARV